MTNANWKTCLYAALGVGLCAVAEVPAWPTFPAELTLVTNVASGTVTLDVSELAGKALLEKRGAGKLVIDADNSAFTGRIDVAEGVLRVTHADALGDRLAPTVVKDGATLEIYGTAKGEPNLGAEPCYFAGTGVTGPDGNPWGALHSSHTMDNSSKPVWPRQWILTGDALVKGDAANQDFNSGCSLDMNGHTLTLSVAGDYDRYAMNVSHPGHVRLVRGGITFRLTGETGGATNELQLASGTHIYLNTAGGAPWTLRAEGTSYLYTGSGGSWPGPVHLESRHACSAQSKGTYIDLQGRVTGPGGFRSGGNAPKLMLQSAANDFQGGVAFSGQTLNLNVNGSLPAGGGLLALTNATLMLASGVDFDLPCANLHGTGVVTQTDARWQGTVTKTGAGTWTVPTTTFTALDVQQGTLAVAVPYADGSLGAGLWQGYTNGYWNAPAVEGLPNVCGYYKTMTNALVRTPAWATTSGTANADLAGNAGAYSYSGYLVNTGATDAVWTFSVNLRARAKFALNGKWWVNTQEWGVRHVFRATVKAGYNPFELCVCSNTKEVGPGMVGNTVYVYDETQGKFVAQTGEDSSFNWKGGFLIDRQGRAPLSDDLKAFPGQWEVPVDPGDGTLFRVARDAAEAEALALQHVTESLRIVDGAVYEAAGWPLVTKTLIGLGAVSNATATCADDATYLKVKDEWRIGCEALQAGAHFTTDRALAFASGAVIRLDSAERLSVGTYRLATAAGGVTGLPEAVSVPSTRRGFRVRREDSSLYLDVVPAGTIFLVR